MSRSTEERIADVRRLLAAARRVYDERSRLVPDIARATGLTPAGVELGFASLEHDASDAELRALVAGAGDAACVHVILSANVFVAPLRAIAIARAAASRVTVRPSRRDPVLARALVEAAGDEGIAIVDERDAGSIDAGEVHLYGRDETIAAVRARARPGVVIRGHGAGMGITVIGADADLDSAADALAADIVPFDQRGCLSPRIAFVEGGEDRAIAFASAVDARLAAWAERAPRGALSDDERAEVRRWCDAMAFAGRLWRRGEHAIAVAPPGAHLFIPPPGRHVQVQPESTLDAVRARVATVERFVVSVGCDDPVRAARVVPRHARIAALGRMQRPPLDGPVDRRSV